jgi:hypothetical protein
MLWGVFAMDEEHIRALFKDIQSMIDANRNDQKRTLDRILMIEAAFKQIRQYFSQQQIKKDPTQKNDD